MESLLFFLGAVIVLSPFIILLVVLSIRQKLNVRIDQLERRLTQLEAPVPRHEAPETRNQERGTRNQDSVPSKQKRSHAEWEALIGTTWLNRIGAIAVILSTVFFLKYAFDNDLINEWGRIIIGLVAGIGLLIGGEVARRRKLAIFSQGLTGSAIVVLYLSVYASFNFYSLVPHIVAFSGMTVVTLIAMVISWRSKAISTSIIGSIGGLATPLLLSTGEMNTVALFAYIFILDAGILAVSLRKRSWIILDALVVAATWLWWFAWVQHVAVEVDDGAAYADFRLPGLVFVWLFTIGFMVHDVLILRLQQGPWYPVERLLSVVSMLASWFFIVSVLNADHPWQSEVSSALFAVLSFAFAWFAEKRSWPPAAASFRYAMVAFLILVVPLEHRDPWIYRLVWAVGGLGVVYYLRDRTFRLPIWIVMAVFTIGVLSFLVGNNGSFDGDHHLPFLNESFGSAFILFIAAFSASTFAVRNEQNDSQKNMLLSFGAIALAIAAFKLADHVGDVLWYSVNVSTDLSDNVSSWYWFLCRGAALTTMALAGTALFAFARYRDLVHVHVAAMVVMTVATVQWLVFEAWELPTGAELTILNTRFAFAVILSTCWFVNTRYFCMTSINWVSRLWPAYGVIAIGLIAFVLFSAEAIYPFGGEDQANARALALSSTWILYGAGLLWIGFAKRSRPIRISALGITALAILKVFLYDLSYLEQPYRIISFIVLGVILLGASFFYTRFKNVILAAEDQES
jgi:uncharacterized membrane protein